MPRRLQALTRPDMSVFCRQPAGSERLSCFWPVPRFTVAVMFAESGTWSNTQLTSAMEMSGCPAREINSSPGFSPAFSAGDPTATDSIFAISSGARVNPIVSGAGQG